MEPDNENTLQPPQDEAGQPPVEASEEPTAVDEETASPAIADEQPGEAMGESSPPVESPQAEEPETDTLDEHQEPTVEEVQVSATQAEVPGLLLDGAPHGANILLQNPMLASEFTAVLDRVEQHMLTVKCETIEKAVGDVLTKDEPTWWEENAGWTLSQLVDVVASQLDTMGNLS